MLALPDAAVSRSMRQLQEVESVRLFVERARALAPTFHLSEQNYVAVAEICRRLEGMPLAIELAAARANLLSPQQILARLDDSVRLLTRGNPSGEARHQTLRAALDWSYNLLSPAEQAFFCHMAAFAGSAGLEGPNPVPKSEITSPGRAGVVASPVMSPSGAT